MDESEIFDGIYKLQTGGFPVDELIVAKTSSGEPWVGTFFADNEMDAFAVEFFIDSEIKIITAGMRYISTAPWQLRRIADLREDAEIVLEELDQFFDAANCEWVGFEGLLTHQDTVPDFDTDDGSVGIDDNEPILLSSGLVIDTDDAGRMFKCPSGECHDSPPSGTLGDDRVWVCDQCGARYLHWRLDSEHLPPSVVPE